MRIPLLVVVLAWWSIAPAEAQGVANSLNELRLLVRPGDRVTITDTRGTDVTGRVEALSPTSIRLMVGDQPRAWQEGEIAVIRQRRADSLGNGALWGLGVGVGLAALAVAAIGVDNADVGWAAAAVAFYGGVGAGVGVGVDALIQRRQVIYEPPSPSFGRLTFTPGRAVARITLRF